MVGGSERRLAHLLDVAARWAVRKLNGEAQTSLDDTDLSRANHEVSELGLDIEAALLRNDEEIATARSETVSSRSLPSDQSQTHSLLMNARLSMDVLARYM